MLVKTANTQNLILWIMVRQKNAEMLLRISLLFNITLPRFRLNTRRLPGTNSENKSVQLVFTPNGLFEATFG
jgi:hypothetical protein